MTTRTYAIRLAIPDNEAFTASETLTRLGIGAARVVRADVWLFEVDDAAAAGLTGAIGAIETIYNPNKHRLAERASDRPGPGEVWIVPRDEKPVTAIGGRTIPGVSAIRRRTAWRLLDETGRDVPAETLARAAETFLCNPAFQEAIF